jgi:peptidoglycan/xylan/chitin deacetylase (PgdA/CDA1 family)
MFDTSPPVSFRRRVLRLAEIGLERSGAGTAYAKLSRGGAVVLMYHSVAGDAEADFVDPAFRMAPDRFRRQMAFLAKHRRVVSLDELTAELAQGSNPEAGTVVITFDDGYLDNLKYAAPILAEYGLPATLYVPTSYIDRGLSQLGDRLYSMLRSRTRDVIAEPRMGKLTLGDPHSVSEVFRRIASELIVLPLLERQALLDALESELKPTAQAPRLTLSWDELRELQERFERFEVGSHSRDHVDLALRTEEEGREAIHTSRDRIAEQLGEAPRHFCFPFNRGSATQRKTVREAGFASAMCSGASELITAGSDPYHLPRIDPNMPDSLFRFVTGGAYPGLPQVIFHQH